MIRFLLRSLGLLFLASAFIFLVYDGTRSIAANLLVYSKADEVWPLVHAASLQQLQPWIEQHAPRWLWDPVMTTILGAPAAVVPVGHSSEELPIGVQIAARPFQDEVALGIAGVLDSAFGFSSPPIALNP